MDNDTRKIKESMIDGLDARLNKDPSMEELLIVNEFLIKHDITFSESELQKESSDSKIDVVFRDCLFQVKKIIFPSNYKPKAEDKAFKDNILTASTRDELVGVTVSELIDYKGWHEPEVLKQLIIETTKYWSCRKSKNKLKYEDRVRANLDLLFYVQSDLTKKKLRVFAFDPEVAMDIKNFGWRSVSYLFGSQSLVLYVADDAPNLLKTIFSEQG